MAKLGLPGGKRTRQPQYAVRVDRSNPLNKGLIVTVNPPTGEAISAVQPAYYGGAVKSPRKNRLAYVSGSTTADAVALALAAGHPLYSLTTDFTISLWIEPTSDADYANYFSVPYRAAGWTNPYNSLVVYKQTGDVNRTQLQWAASSTTSDSFKFATQIISVAANSYANYVFTRSGSACAAYKNGVLVENGTATANSVIDWGEKRPLVLLNSTDSSLPNGGYIGFQDGLDIWNRALDANEIKRYFDNRWQIFQPRKRQIYVDVASGSQNLSPGLYSDADTFYSATVSPGSVALTPSLYVDSDTFYAATVSQALTPSLYADADTFYAPTVTPGAVTLAPALYSDSDTFFAATVTPGSVSLTPGLYSDADTFYAASVTPGAVNVAPGLYSDADTFYAATVSADGSPQTLTPALYADADTFYAATVAPGAVNLAPSIYTDADTFHAATVAAGYNLQPAAFADADTFYAATVSGGQAVLSPDLFIDPDIFYSATVVAPTLLSAPRTLISHTQTASRSNIQTARRP